ncbi:MAG: ABC transporter ATP-binding protein [Myxococcales bacterium]|nr:ABC transporter ATP-binding protein [Myxococcales bacterium]
MAELVLQGVSHSYELARGASAVARKKPPAFALRELDLRWRDGGAYALLGPSGCGKSTLLGILSGLLRPTSGQVLFDGKDVTELSSRERNVAQVFQFPVVYDTMTVRDNLAFPLRNRGLSSQHIAQRVRDVADALELGPALDKRATRLTADEKQILALGRGLVREDVAAILFDEPLTVIDPHRKWMLRRKLKEIHRQFRHTLIYVTHDQTEALTFADEVVVMSTGAVLQRGTPEELFLRPAHTYVGTFIGSPGMNLLPCQLVTRDAQVWAKVGGHELGLGDGVRAALAQRAGESPRLELGIRPEHVTLEPGDGAAGVPLEVTAIEDHGRFRIVVGKLGGEAVEGGPLVVKARLPGGEPAAAAVGQTVRVRFAADRVCLYEQGHLVAAAPLPAPPPPSLAAASDAAEASP